MKRWSRLLPLIGLTLAYFVAGKLGLQLAFVQANATPVWPPTGIALAAFLLFGNRVWPAIALGAFLVNLTTEGNFATSLGIATGNTLEGLLGAYFARRFCAGVAAFEQPQDILRYTVLVAGLATTLSASFGVTSLSLGGYSDWERYGAVWLTWWLGDVAGALIVAPLLILWSAQPRLLFDRRRILEASLLALALVATGAAVFGWPLPLGARYYARDFMAAPPLVWAAFRFGPRGTATAAFALSWIALAGTVDGHGPFARRDPNESLLLLQTFMSTTGLGALLFASLVAVNRKFARDELLEERLRFETLLSDLFAGMIPVQPREIDAALRDGLRRVVAFLDVDRGNLDEHADGDGGVHLSYALPGVDGAPRVVDREHFPWTAERLLRGERVEFSRIEELPEEAAIDRASYRCVGTRSKLSLPLRAGGRIVGALSFGSVRRERAWPPELVERLRLLCEVFANALARSHAELEAERLRQDLAHIGRVSAVGELTASLAHELNQPLSAILSNAQAARRMLEVQPADLAEIGEILRDIVVDDKRAGEVIRRLRALLRKGELERASLDVNEIVDEVARLVRSDAAMRGVSVRVEPTRGLPRVRGDRVQLQQVVLNLVLNALEAMRATQPGERALVIRTARHDDAGVAVAVTDTGPGIDEKDEERLFEPLYTTKADGLGMGLAIARTIVLAHGGRLVAENNAGRGATFRFTLPAAAEDAP